MTNIAPGTEIAKMKKRASSERFRFPENVFTMHFFHKNGINAFLTTLN